MHDSDGAVARALTAVAAHLSAHSLKLRTVRAWRSALADRERLRRHFQAWATVIDSGDRPQSSSSIRPPTGQLKSAASAVAGTGRRPQLAAKAADSKTVRITAAPASAATTVAGIASTDLVPTIEDQPTASSAPVSVQPARKVTSAAVPPPPVAAFAGGVRPVQSFAADITPSDDVGAVGRQYRRNCEKWIKRRAFDWWLERVSDRQFVRSSGPEAAALLQPQAIAVLRWGWLQWKAARVDRERKARAERLRLFEIQFAKEQAIEARNERIRNW